MKQRLARTFIFPAAIALAVAGATPGSQAAKSDSAPLRYDAQGRMVFPADYRDWVFLSSGLNMSYSDAADTSGMSMFGNTFAPPAAYAVFKKTGRWPDRTVLTIENRMAGTKGSINKHGQYQTQETVGFEAHVKDHTLAGGWGFFAFDNDETPAQQIPHTAQCYSCHQAHAAADTTFVQFYPTLLPIATKLKTLNPAYVAEEKAR